MIVVAPPAFAVTLQPGFQQQTIFSGLVNPTTFRFAPDGRVFVVEKRGVIKVFDSITDPTPDVFADLRVNTYNFWDRGMLGLALDPQFSTTSPYVYVLYTFNKDPASPTVPRWVDNDPDTPLTVDGDPCPSPPGATADGCVVLGRLSRLKAVGNFMDQTVGEQVLVEDWCQQYPSHSVGGVEFGPDGALYATAGDGASFNFVDWGQDGSPVNPCGDPPGGRGTALAPPTAEGGALRSQDLRTTTDPTTLDGAVIRVDKATGLGITGNPRFSLGPDENARKIIAHGIRNPYRFTFRPGTDELWLGDVGWNTWEEINRVRDVNDEVMENFGWPCYEGAGRQSGYDSANLDICENLYAGGVTSPYFAYNHSSKVVPGESCPTGSSSITGVSFEFYSGGPYPAAYDGALFFADYSRGCIWAMKKGAGTNPKPSLIETFAAGAASPVDLQLGPTGELYYADFDGGTIRRIRYIGANNAPSAVATADPTSGVAPLDVAFDGSGSSDPDATDTLNYAWDLDGDGAYDDSTSVTPTYTYGAGTFTVKLRVTDGAGEWDVSDPITISASNDTPVPTIDLPATGTTWSVGDVIGFSGSASDDQADPNLSWKLILHHCPSTCHTHTVQTWTGPTGSFVAPDHEYPSHVELRLTATDRYGAAGQTSVLLYPRTVDVTLISDPAGLQLSMNGSGGTSMLTTTVIEGSTNTISATTPQTLNGTNYKFSSWSDGGAQTHSIIANASSSYTASYVVDDGSPTITGTPPSPVARTTPYSFTFTMTGGPSLTTSVTSGSLPPGITLSSSGMLSGAPTTVGSYTATVTATNGNADATTTFTIVVTPPTVTITPNSGPKGAPVTLNAAGFAPGEQVKFKYKTGLTSPTTVALCTAIATTNGTATCSGHIPTAGNQGQRGARTIVAKGTTSLVKATTTFTLT